MRTKLKAKTRENHESEISVSLRNAMERFLAEIDAEFFSKSLRFMLIEFMRTEEGKSSYYTDRLLDHLERLYFLLDEIEEENKRRGITGKVVGLYR